MDDGLSAIGRSFSRCVSRRRDPLSSEGARLFGGRFNPVGTPALYLAGSPTLAVAEALQLAEMFSVVSFNPRLLVSIDVKLSEVLDLTSGKTVGLLGLTEAGLLAEWRGSAAPSATQHIGAQAQESGVEAILFPSRIERGVSNLCVFRENLRATSWLTVEGYDDVFPLAE